MLRLPHTTRWFPLYNSVFSFCSCTFLRLASAACSEGLQDAAAPSCRVGSCVLAQLGFRVDFSQAAQNVLRLLLVVWIAAPGLHMHYHFVLSLTGGSHSGM